MTAGIRPGCGSMPLLLRITGARFWKIVPAGDCWTGAWTARTPAPRFLSVAVGAGRRAPARVGHD